MRPAHGLPHIRERTWMEVLATAAAIGALLVAMVEFLTHAVAPRLLAHHERFPALASAPTRTENEKHVAGDPINVAFVGSAGEVSAAMRAIGWSVPDSLSRASDIAIARSVLENRPDSTAPVSSLFLFGRRQDLAFEKEVGRSARHRHHARLWLDSAVQFEGREVWLGAATYDASAGISHRTLHPTHHIAPDIDQERDGLENILAHRGELSETFRVTGVGVRVDAKNAEGDRYDTDGELRVMVVSPGNVPHAAPVDPGVPPLVALKDQLWAWAHRQ